MRAIRGFRTRIRNEEEGEAANKITIMKQGVTAM